jgi:hypothetical protein
MNLARTKASQSVGVGRGAVPFVVSEAIAGVGPVKFKHNSVARGFGENGGRRDRGADAITADHGLNWAWQGESVVPVHQSERRRGVKRFDRAAHGETRSVQNIESRDLSDGGKTDAPGQSAYLDLDLQGLAAPRRQTLGVVETLDDLSRPENDGARADWTRPRAASCLIDPAYGRGACALQKSVRTRAAYAHELVANSAWRKQPST